VRKNVHLKDCELSCLRPTHSNVTQSQSPQVEYIIVKFDHKDRIARVSLKAEEVFHKIAERNKNNM
jgi:hypothetical protein